MQGFAGAPGHGLFNEEAGYCPTASLVNKMVFAAKAGDACIFDIATCVRVKPEQSSPAPHALCCCFATTSLGRVARLNSCHVWCPGIMCAPLWGDPHRFHTSMPNTSSLPREAIITTCSDAGGFGESQRDLVDGWDSAGLLNDAPTRRMLGRA
jgi:hypothetical protein